MSALPRPVPSRVTRLLFWLIEISTPWRDRDVLVGDLVERHHRRRLRTGGGATALWLLSETARTVSRNVGRRLTDPDPPGSEATRRNKESTMLPTLFQDLRFAARDAARRPLFTLVVVVTLAVGIAATAVVYSAVDGLVLRPFRFPELDRLVGVGNEFPKMSQPLSFVETLSPAEFVDIREQSESLEKVVAWDMGNRQLARETGAENVRTAFWWGDALPTLGVRAALGRGFTEEEIREGRQVAVIAHGRWQNDFGGDPGIVGSTVLVNGEPYEVVGVLPAGVALYGTELWTPMPVGPERFPRSRRQFQVLARLAEGYELADARAELAALADRVEAAHAAELPEYEGWNLVPQTWRSINVQRLEPLAWMLGGFSAFVLLLVCANVASLLLGRSSGRVGEMLVRRALGAGRFRLARQVLTESVFLALLGSLGALLLAWWGTRAVASGIGTIGLGLPGQVELNPRVLAVAVAMGLGTGVLFGLAPALYATRARARSDGLRQQGSSPGRGLLRLQGALVTVQVALALTLVFGGALLVGSFLELQSTDPGFETDELLTLRITLPWERYGQAGIVDFFAQLEERLEAVAAVGDVGLATQFPPILFSRRQFTLEGQSVTDEGQMPYAFLTAVSPTYFQTLGVPLLRGRGFEPGDRLGSPIVAVVNELFEERYFGGRSALGQRFLFDPEQPPVEIVGVVPTVRNRGLERAPEPEIFGNVRQGVGGNQLFVLLRSELDPVVLAESVRATVRELDPEQGIYATRTMDDLFLAQSAPRRFATRITLWLGAFALLLAMVGVYSVVSLAALARRREIGLRLALGARATEVRAWLMRRVSAPLFGGCALGLLGALGAGRLLQRVTSDVSGAGGDPAALAVALAILGGVGLLAILLPTRRASRVDPMETLRAD